MGAAHSGRYRGFFNPINLFAGAGRDGDPGYSFFRRHAEMAADETEDRAVLEEPRAEMAAADRAAPRQPDSPAADEAERLRAALKEANRKALADRKRVEELEALEEERKSANLSEMDRLKKQLAEIEARRRDAEVAAQRAAEELKQSQIDHAIEDEARSHNKAHPELYPRLVDKSGIQIDDAKGVVGVKEAVKKFLDKYPRLAEQPGSGGTPPPRDAARRFLPGAAGAGDKDQPTLEDYLRRNSAAYQM
jgi:hypothetical protein